MSKAHWRPHPLHTTVIDLLSHKGAMTDTELLKLVRETIGDVSSSELNRVLLKLELNGLIYVSSLARGERRVELRTR